MTLWHTRPSEAPRVTPSPPRALSPPPSRHSAAALQLNLYQSICKHIYIYISIIINVYQYQPLSSQRSTMFQLCTPGPFICCVQTQWLFSVKSTQSHLKVSCLCISVTDALVWTSSFCQISQKVTIMGHDSLWLKSWWNTWTMICPCSQAFLQSRCFLNIRYDRLDPHLYVLSALFRCLDMLGLKPRMLSMASPCSFKLSSERSESPHQVTFFGHFSTPVAQGSRYPKCSRLLAPHCLPQSIHKPVNRWAIPHRLNTI